MEAKQVALAVKLKYSYTGAEILRLYADVAYFGNGYYGLEAASCGYFGVRPPACPGRRPRCWPGWSRAPPMDDPVTNPANARAREEHVIGRLVATGALTPAQASRALRIPLSGLLAHGGQALPSLKPNRNSRYLT